MAIKAADLGHACKDLESHKKWSRLLMDETIALQSLEMKLNLNKPTSYIGNDTVSVAKIQVKFLKNIVYPLYEAFNEVLSSQEIEKIMDQLDRNLSY